MPRLTIFWKSQIRHSELTHRYTRPRGKQPDYTAPVVLRNGKNTVRHFCDAIHKNIVPNFKNGEFGFHTHLYPSPRSSFSLSLLYHYTAILLSCCPAILLYHQSDERKLTPQPWSGVDRRNMPEVNELVSITSSRMKSKLSHSLPFRIELTSERYMYI
jgi:hypothetical protein